VKGHHFLPSNGTSEPYTSLPPYDSLVLEQHLGEG